MEKRLERLAEQHRDLDTLFRLHQESLLLSEPELALESFRHYSHCLSHHIDIEETYLLPELSRLNDATGQSFRWRAELYFAEHRKLEALLAECERTLREFAASWPALSASARRRASIRQLADEHALTHVAEHHEEREEIALFPELSAFFAVQAHPKSWPERFSFPERLQEERAALLKNAESAGVEIPEILYTIVHA